MEVKLALLCCDRVKLELAFWEGRDHHIISLRVPKYFICFSSLCFPWNVLDGGSVRVCDPVYFQLSGEAQACERPAPALWSSVFLWGKGAYDNPTEEKRKF